MAAFTKADVQAVLLPVSHAFHTQIVAPGLGAHAPHPRAAAHRAAPDAGGRERHRRLLRHGPGGAAAHPRGAQPAGGLPGPVREGARDPARGGRSRSSSRWDRRRPSRASSTTSWARTPRSHRSSPTTPSSPTSWLSTRHCAGSTRRGWAWARQQQKRLRSGGSTSARPQRRARSYRSPVAPRPAAASPSPAPTASLRPDRHQELGRLFAEFLERGLELYSGGKPAAEPSASEPVVITGCGLGLPGLPRVFDDSTRAALLRGEQLIGAVPAEVREAHGEQAHRPPRQERGRRVALRVHRQRRPTSSSWPAGREPSTSQKEFGVSAERIPALDVVTRLAIGAGLEALRDAGIPLVMRYKTTTRGTSLPERWALPDALRDDTGSHLRFRLSRPRLLRRGHDALSQGPRPPGPARRAQGPAVATRRRRDAAPRPSPSSTVGSAETQASLDQDGFVFDRRFLFRILSMGHSQFAEHIGARGPNTQVNAACASTTQAVGLAEDWIRAGRCRRVIVVSADDATSDLLMEWIGAGFLASGAAATDERVEDAALPFDRRRHGMVVGMGAAALVVESAEAARERGITPICEVLSAGHREQRLPRHPARRPPHLARSWRPWSPRRESRGGVERDEMAPRDRVRLPRDLHPGPRRQRLGRGPRAQKRLRIRRRPHRDGQHQGLHRPCHGRGDRGRGGGALARDGPRAPRRQLQGGRPGARSV